MSKATIEIECRNEGQLETITMILEALEDVHVRDGYIHAERSDANCEGGENGK